MDIESQIEQIKQKYINHTNTYITRSAIVRDINNIIYENVAKGNIHFKRTYITEDEFIQILKPFNKEYKLNIKQIKLYTYQDVIGYLSIENVRIQKRLNYIDKELDYMIPNNMEGIIIGGYIKSLNDELLLIHQQLELLSQSIKKYEELI